MHIGIREMYKIQDMSVKKGIKRVYFLSLCGNISSCAAGTFLLPQGVSHLAQIANRDTPCGKRNVPHALFTHKNRPGDLPGLLRFIR